MKFKYLDKDKRKKIKEQPVVDGAVVYNVELYKSNLYKHTLDILNENLSLAECYAISEVMDEMGISFEDLCILHEAVKLERKINDRITRVHFKNQFRNKIKWAKNFMREH